MLLKKVNQLLQEFALFISRDVDQFQLEYFNESPDESIVLEIIFHVEDKLYKIVQLKYGLQNGPQKEYYVFNPFAQDFIQLC